MVVAIVVVMVVSEAAVLFLVASSGWRLKKSGRCVMREPFQCLPLAARCPVDVNQHINVSLAYTHECSERAFLTLALSASCARRDVRSSLTASASIFHEQVSAVDVACFAYVLRPIVGMFFFQSRTLFQCQVTHVAASP